ncbi:ubiquinone biosynthesis accessory factor UbiJ [Reinekea blandensis]|uniref:Ubiquinone biosynthesis accessory factor UbiJ n=1 Tax=Reinekea blandensis MED297 TaxID=314283 RepID=A4B9V3_9GAMM|nr:SCP2 sterol-binding domain-containing protein [Reinekea blandensis]EAR11404.1 hypothetical protein MED297_20992 [Reinekea sp. MED297] [Reinekea blandensis MED297]
MTGWLLPLQTLINDGLNYDPQAREKIVALAGKTLVLQVTEPSVSFSVSIEADGFVFCESGTREPFDARVSGRAADLFAVLRAEDRTAAMMAHSISIEGDTRTFFAIQAVMSHLDIDWEMAIGDRIGDLAAHVISDGLRFFSRVARNQFNSAARTGRNFLREESGWLVPQSLWQDHVQELTRVRQDTERLQARLNRLQARVKAMTS